MTCIHLFNFANHLKKLGDWKDFDLMLSQACIDPWSDFCVPLHQIMPLDQILLYIYCFLGVYSNIYLFLFLK